MQNWSKYVTRAHVQWHPKPKALRYNDTKPEIDHEIMWQGTQYTKCIISVHAKQSFTQKTLHGTRDSVEWFLKKKTWAVVATLLKKWNSLDYNMRQYKD